MPRFFLLHETIEKSRSSHRGRRDAPTTYTVGTITKRTSLSLSDEAGLRTARVEKKSGLRAKRTSAIHCTRAKELYYNSTTNSGGNELPFLYRKQ